MERFAETVIRFRWPIFIFITLLTIFLGWQATYVRFRTAISGLWPANHPFIKVHYAYEDYYGSPLTVYVMVRVKKGTIYNPETLEKIARITWAIDAIPGVNHDQVVSITSRKVKTLTLRGSEIHVGNLFPRDPPRTERELARFQDNVAAAGVIGTLVSFDGTASLISGNFIEKSTDIWPVFQLLLEIKKQEQDDNHEIFLAGQPVLMGWVRTYQREILTISGISIGFMFFTLYLYTRSVRLTLFPLLATLVSTIWGFGFAGLLRYALDPLVLLIPFLLMARTLSHGIQKVERIIEWEEQPSDAHAKARTLILALFGSGMLGIVTDVLGILIIAITSIPVMRQLAFFCSFWAASVIFSVLIFIPVLVSLVGIPTGRQIIQRLEESSITRILKGIGWLVTGRQAKWVMACVIIIALGSFFFSSRINIGDVHPGTALLWPESPFNIAVKNINDAFMGIDELYVIVRPREKEEKSLRAAEALNLPTGGVIKGEETKAALAAFLGIRQVPVLNQMQDFQRYMEQNPLVRRTFSYADFLPIVNRRFHGNYVKWEFLPGSTEEVAQFSHQLLRGTDPGDFNRFVSDKYEHANIMIWLKDHRGETLGKIVEWIKEYLDQYSGNSAAEFQLASGSAGVLAAVNDEVARKELLMFVLSTAIVGLSCMVTFHSFLAAIILMIPLIVTNSIVMSIMVFMEAGLDVNTLPIVSIGMGVGIDYGIYLLTRILQEYRRKGDYADAISLAICTTGRAIFFTASVMVASIGVWYFLSSFRFMAEMGFLLAMVMGINMLGALLVVPAIIMVTKPRFALTARLLVWD